MTAAPRRAESGFTLLEILVALVVLGFLMAGLAQGVAFGVHAWNNQIGNVARNADLDGADRILRLLLARAQPPAAPDRPSLRGQVDVLQFVSEMPRGAPTDYTRIAAITLRVDSSHRLMLQWHEQPHATLIGPRPPDHDEVLLEGVSGLVIGYRSRTGAWSSTWTTPTLPQLVRIHIDFSPGSARRWPEIVVAPMRDSISETGE